MLPTLYGVRLSMDAASADLLAPWLDSDLGFSSGPTIEVKVTTYSTQPAPVVLEMHLEEPLGWLGRTATGLIVGNQRSWLTIEQSPPKIRGVLGDDGTTRELLLGALIVALRSMGAYLIHAAAVSFDDQALLLVGDSGAGKSTTAIALVSAGCSYIGDDGCLIRQRSSDVELLPLWSSFRLSDQSLASFSALRSHSFKLASDEKWKLDVRTAFPDRYLTHWLGRKTLLFLERSTEHSSSLHELSQAEALGLLIRQSNALTLGCHPNPREHLDLLARLVAVAPRARLRLGTEWLRDPVGAAERLRQHARSFLRPRELHSEAS